jgi:golgi-specific brefeldin A-resistance guanine nucleotide exchange factor 1
LSPELASSDHTEWTNIFSEVLFPLINQLLKPEVYQTDQIGMPETRTQAAQLLCKIFLHYLVLLSEWDGMLDLWSRILDIIDRMMNSGQTDSLLEAVEQSVKNVLLILQSDGHLVAPPAAVAEDTRSDLQQKMWRETWRLEKILPGLMTDLFPNAGQEQQTQVSETEQGAKPGSQESEPHAEAPESSSLPTTAVTERQAA